MRTLSLLTLGVIFVVGAPGVVNAQAPASDGSRYYFNVSMGGQSKEQSFTDTSSFDIYGEKGAVATAHSIGGGTLFDVGVAMRVRRVRKDFAIGLAYSTVTNRNDAVSVVRVPHPLIVGQSRTATATVSSLEHSENVIHLQFIWMIPLTNKFDLAVMAGPSFFTVRQSVATVRAPQDITDVAPFSSITINSVSVTDVKESPVGVHIGFDGTYLIRTIKGVGIGVGGFVRYSRASLELATPLNVTRDSDLRAGGPQGALGLRFRF